MQNVIGVIKMFFDVVTICHNQATIDHVYPKGDIRRFVIKDKKNTVLSCYECNQLRNTQFEKEKSEFFKYLWECSQIDLLQLVSND